MLAWGRFKGYGMAHRKGRNVAAAKVEIYTKMFCGYCHRAKGLLAAKGVNFVEYDITMDREKRDEMRARAPGATTVPQIFIDGKAIGGSDDLAALERAGELDGLLER
jgi:glutaredoxin 3